ncbi:MAG: single-stranded-DNA-specific exonuclease RecJ [Patescibacteria group bacterium]|nr:single-stranded-DNA-specific exonuclease RecJ [Patescibacteria group bacterium]
MRKTRSLDPMIINYFKEIKSTEEITSERIIELILQRRKVDNLEEFINPPSPEKISLSQFGPRYQKEFFKVIKILEEIYQKKEPVVVYTDYDADGITGGAILWETLYLLGFNVMPYVPDRVTEGYGLSIKGIDKVISQLKPRLIITVDNGITKIREISYAKKMGLRVIVTDHHLKSETLPNADAIFHIPILSGSGVAYFFSKEIFHHFYSKAKDKEKVIKDNFSTDYLGLAMIGTIADSVSLTGHSRAIVKHGLAVFPRIKRIGLKHILKEARIDKKKITPYEVGFIIAPRINASGRLTNALDALRLLCTKKETRASYLASFIGQINRQRQDMLEKSITEAKTVIEKKRNFFLKNKMITLVSENWHEGIIGLIASKIAEEFYRPTLIITKTNAHYKGSARSVTGFDITGFLRHFSSYFIDIGGHQQAAGFTLKKEQVSEFVSRITQKANQVIEETILERKLSVDLKISLTKLSLELGEKIEKLAPFGIGNPEPLFMTEIVVESAKIFGKKNEHLKIYGHDYLKNNSKSTVIDSPFEFIAFNQAQYFSQLARDQRSILIYTLEVDRWHEKKRLRGKVVEILK